MNLEKARLLSNRVLVAIAVFFVLVGLVALISFFLNRSNTVYGKIDKPTITNLLETKPQWVTYNFDLVDVPKQAPVVMVSSRTLTKLDILEFGKKFGFKNAPNCIPSSSLCDMEKSILFNWNEENANLSVEIKKGKLTFKDAKALTKEVQTTLDDEELKTKAIDYLKDKGLSSGVQKFTTKATYFNLTGEIFTETLERGGAKIVEIAITENFRNFELINEERIPPYSIQFLKDGTVYSVTALLRQLKDDGALYPLLSSGEVKEAIDDGLGIVAAFTSTAYGSPILTSPDFVYLGKGKIILFEGFDEKYIQPVFAFESSVEQAKKRVPVEIYYPAIKEEFLKN